MVHNVAILGPAAAFVDAYLDALRTMQPEEVGRAPCFGYGRGGVAYTLLKAGLLRGDLSLVRCARRWVVAGLHSGRRFRMRYWPKASFSRGLTGLHAIHALAAHAGGDGAASRRELQRFVDTARRARGRIELFQGTAGRLAGAGVVMRTLPDPGVRTLGDELAARLVHALEARAVPLELPGLAHGRAGVMLAVLAWQEVSQAVPEDALRRIVRAAHPYDVSSLSVRRQADWAHGHAGMAMLFARAYAQLGDRCFLRWAREAAAHAQVLPHHSAVLLDGTPGIAYSLLAVAAADPEGPWRELAWTVAAQTLARIEVPALDPYGVWSGLGGACCLALDLLHQTEARFPGVEA